MISNTCGSTNNYMNTSFESCLAEKESILDYNFSSDLAQFSSADGNGEEEGSDLGVVDFKFVDELGSYDFSPFEIAEDNSETMEQEVSADEPSMLGEAMKRMKYERKFSASLYAFNGIPECLKLKTGSGGLRQRRRSDQLTNLGNSCDTNHEEHKRVEEGRGVDLMEKKKEETLETSTDIRLSSLFNDGELSLWNSLDPLPSALLINW